MTALQAQAGRAALIFAGFAFAYFFSALLRAITATLAPIFSQELGLQSADLGLLAGAYFLGFSAMQLPLGYGLDRWGPKRVMLSLLVMAVAGCCAFALADSLPSLFAARVMIGAGVSAGLMAPLTCYRRLFTPAAQLRANSWMLMTGSLGMVASTLPVHALLPLWGWRGIFWVLAGMLVLSMAVIALVVPRDPPIRAPGEGAAAEGYAVIFRHPVFVRSAPMGFFIYGGLIAVQSLWAGPWLTRVAGWTPGEAAQGLFVVNLSMLLAFMTWGAIMPRLAARGVSVRLLIVRAVPLSLLILSGIVLWPEPAQAWTWALWCVSCTFVSLSQPAVAQAFEAKLAGRALSAFNLVIFSGVFAIQWGLGLTIEALQALGYREGSAFRGAFGLFLAFCLLSYLWYARGGIAAPRAVRGE